MPTRTISITEEAYQRLSLLKEDRESFSEIIMKVTGKVDLLEFAGILTKEEADGISKRVREGRAASRKRADRIRREIRHAS